MLATGVTWKIVHNRDDSSGSSAAVASSHVPAETVAGSSQPVAPAAAAKAAPTPYPTASAAAPAAGKSHPQVGTAAIDVGVHHARGRVLSYTEEDLILSTSDAGKMEFDLPTDPAWNTRIVKGEFVVVGYTEAGGRKKVTSVIKVQQ